jgi:hypothetical protein
MDVVVITKNIIRVMWITGLSAIYFQHLLLVDFSLGPPDAGFQQLQLLLEAPQLGLHVSLLLLLLLHHRGPRGQCYAICK